jgi:hypothetical protein
LDLATHTSLSPNTEWVRARLCKLQKGRTRLAAEILLKVGLKHRLLARVITGCHYTSWSSRRDFVRSHTEFLTPAFINNKKNVYFKADFFVTYLG